MTTRAQLASHALADNGYLDGCLYPGPANKYTAYVGHGAEFSCGDAVTYWFGTSGLHLPSMQAGMAHGFAYCPAAYTYGQAHGIIIPSYKAQPGDIVLFDWNGDGTCDHTEIVTSLTDGVLYTIGGDSGPSNVDGYKGEGGTHRHKWQVGTTGNPQIRAVLDASRLVTFVTQSYPTLILKSPYMRGYDISNVQLALNHHGASLVVDGVYGQKTHDAVYHFEKVHWPSTAAMWNGQVNATVRQALGLPTG